MTKREKREFQYLKETLRGHRVFCVGTGPQAVLPHLNHLYFMLTVCGISLQDQGRNVLFHVLRLSYPGWPQCTSILNVACCPWLVRSLRAVVGQ